MKTIIGAIALLLSAPAIAQATPADPHAGHAQHQGHQQPAQQPHGDHSQHKMDCCKTGGCCDKMKQTAAKMDCCKDQAAGTAGHAGHAAKS
jgi:hypothetical protein